jgi:hypothetical protein
MDFAFCIDFMQTASFHFKLTKIDISKKYRPIRPQRRKATLSNFIQKCIKNEHSELIFKSFFHLNSGRMGVGGGGRIGSKQVLKAFSIS